MVELHLRLPTARRNTASAARAVSSVMVSAHVDRDCGRAQLTVDAEDPNVLVYVEEWPDLEHLERRIRSEPFGVLLSVMETCPTPPVMEFRFMSETRGLEYVAAVRQAGTALRSIERL